MPSRSMAMALISPSRWRETSTLNFNGGRLKEGRHEMLAMPRRKDERSIDGQPVVDVGRLDGESARLPYQVEGIRTPQRRSFVAPTARTPIASSTAFARGRRSTPLAVRIEQSVQMNDEIAHMRIVDGLLRLRPPRRIGGRIVRIDADDVELVQILEVVARRAASARRRRRDGAIAWARRSPTLSSPYIESGIEPITRTRPANRARARPASDGDRVRPL